MGARRKKLGHMMQVQKGDVFRFPETTPEGLGSKGLAWKPQLGRGQHKLASVSAARR